ncbi:MAG: 6-phosphofructokinase [Chloroflexi bacterium]|nr:6-phosphofructokinase [Chloroflexota bacterium]
MRRVAVMTSGGDAPGMNAAIRGVVRAGLYNGWEMFGIREGFAGLMAGDYRPLGARDVGGIIQLGGTMLGSARAPEFKTPEGQAQAVARLSQAGIDAVAVIGGNGSQTGAHALSQHGIPVVGIASTIDNDLTGSDITIGVDTALNIALEAIDRLKTTASSHRRAFLVEVMGRDCGYLALMAGIAGGAEAICIPEFPVTNEEIAQVLQDAYKRGKTHGMVVVAEGATNDANELAQYLHQQSNNNGAGFEVRATTLGHVQRGGIPTAYDRLLGSRLAAHAMDCLAGGQYNVLAGQLGGKMAATPLAEVAGRTKPIPTELFGTRRGAGALDRAACYSHVRRSTTVRPASSVPSGTNSIASTRRRAAYSTACRTAPSNACAPVGSSTSSRSVTTSRFSGRVMTACPPLTVSANRASANRNWLGCRNMPRTLTASPLRPNKPRSCCRPLVRESGSAANAPRSPVPKRISG